MHTQLEVNKFADYCESTLRLHDKLIVNGETDPNQTFYKSLPLCIMDAVFSIGVNYNSVVKAENNFLKHVGLNVSRTSTQNEYTVGQFLAHMGEAPDFEQIAAEVYKNKQRTSSSKGILKAEAVYRVVKVFEKHGIDTLEDFQSSHDRAGLDADILAVKGQGSGIMLKYLYMLAGDADEVKPDRHMVNFMKGIFPHLTMAIKHHAEIKNIMREAVDALKVKYPQLTPRFLDFLIWDYQRKK